MIFEKSVLLKKVFFFNFPALQGPGPGPYGPIWAHMKPTTTFSSQKCVKQGSVFPELFPLFKGPGRAHMGPYGPIWAYMGPYGSSWALTGH